jgi:hypothetical protein
MRPVSRGGRQRVSPLALLLLSLIRVSLTSRSIDGSIACLTSHICIIILNVPFFCSLSLPAIYLPSICDMLPLSPTLSYAEGLGEVWLSVCKAQ